MLLRFAGAKKPCSAALDFADSTLFSTVSGEDTCDLTDHYTVWGYFDISSASAGASATPHCPLPEFPQ
ncbi:MAG: hypothetical protein HOJ07_03205 [Rhodospirillaceae bacterium]|nr:hypothetical protein [Rhodospirillaceae bacterium]MBT5779088.1 hypothetical protein [Rhodospirillaceae bacterium]MBT7293845.1 hypothetical protein [Rhodospirillaceae bacterium]